MKAKTFSMFAIFSLMAVMLLALPAVESDAQSYSAVSVLIAGPETIGVNGTLEYTINLVGGPAEGIVNGLWEYEASLELENETGSAAVSPEKLGNSTVNLFKVNVTAPALEQTMTLVVTGHSIYGNDSAEATGRYEIRVIKPVVLRARVSNNGKVAVSDVPVAFYAGGEEIARTTTSLEPGESKVVEVNWTGFQSGEYTVEVRIDPEGKFFNSNVEASTLSEQYYVGEKSNIMVWIFGIILLAVGFLTFTMVMNARRPQRPTGAPAKWRKKK